MLSKALVTLAVAFFTLASNGSGAASASDPKKTNAGPFPSPVTTLSECESPGEEQDVREEFHQTYPISPTGRVSLENLNGGVQIKVWDRAEVQVDAVKRAYRRERLAEANIEVNSTSDSIRIKTDYPDRSQSFHSGDRRYDNPAIVDYILTVPRKAILQSISLINGSLNIDGVEGNVQASSINGRLTARGLQGEAKLSTVNGQLHATFTELSESKPIFLQSVNGSVTLVIPPNANASVRASTVHGSITNDFGLSVRHGEYVGHDLSGQIGSGGPRIKLGNVNGGIRITHRQDARRGSTATVVDAAQLSEEIKQSMAAQTTEAVRISRQTARMRDVALRQAQREIERAQAEIQREVERAQIEAQREAQSEIREQVRVAARAGRGIGVGAGRGVGEGTGYGGRFVSQETKSFPVSGSPRVNIGTFDGSIVVHGWDKAEVTYNATKRAEDEGYLKQISVRTEQQGSTISIIARADEDNGTAHLEVYVPRQSSVHATSDDGSLSLTGVNGDLTLRTGDGSIEVMNAGGQLQASTGDGRINVSNFDGQVDARTGDGAISLDGNFNAVTARTGDGPISLAVPPGANFTVETNASAAESITNEGLSMTEDVSPSQRVRRWRIGSGGKVFVLSTGEGRILLRSR